MKTCLIFTRQQYIKVPSHIYTRRSPDALKNLRAKTVRIGKIRWPPFNSAEIDNAAQQRSFFLIFLFKQTTMIAFFLLFSF